MTDPVSAAEEDAERSLTAPSPLLPLDAHERPVHMIKVAFPHRAGPDAPYDEHALVRREIQSTHNLGACRMSADPTEGVANGWGRSHDVANLLISDGSQVMTGAATNPTLTVGALAVRQAEPVSQLPIGAL